MNHKMIGSVKTSRMTYAAICLTLAILLGSALANAAGPSLVKVELKESASVSRDMIFLEDIAVIGGEDAALMGRLQSVIVARSPLPGSSRNLSSGEVMIRLKKAGIDIARIQLTGPEAAIITRKTVTIEGRQVEGMVREYVLKNLADQRIEMTLKEIRVPDKVVLPAGRVRYEVTRGPQAEMLGRFAVGVTFRVNESYEKKIWASVTVEALADAVVTVRALGRYRPITAEDVIVRKIDVSELPANAISDIDEVIGKRTRRAVHSNRVLSTDMVELPPLVKRGDFVTIIAQLEGLKITTLGKVKRKGRQGERIPVLNMDSQKVIFARVVDANTVAVEF